MKRSDIGWTDYSGGKANFVLRGKAKGDCEHSEGCANCYAWLMRNRNPEETPDYTTFSTDKLQSLARVRPRENRQPYRRGPGSRPMVFVVDMGDLFHEAVPDALVMQALDVFRARSDVDWQILTKRVDRLVSMWGGVVLPFNVWVGVTAENQRRADERLPLLCQVPAAVRFVSVEPMLEPVLLDLTGIAWVICGGESGGHRRSFDKAWAAALWEQCRAAGIPFFFKQGSAGDPGHDDLLGGQRIKQWPVIAAKQD
jgi:protein gp37